MIGRVLNDRYEITERLGGGGMAVVLKATDRYLGRTVSIKVLRDQFVSDGDFLSRFRREAQAVASLSHPNIVSIYDVGHDGDIHYLVMEYVEGESLQKKIAQEGSLAPEAAVDIALQILGALEHAHHRRVIHRDIKPHNILITPGRQIKVADFGVARAAGVGTIVHTGNIVGSAHYFSPEQARGGPVDARSDLYALGVVLFEMLTGRVPFQGENPVSVALKHVQEEPPSVRAFNPAVPAALDRIVSRALAKDPAHRYQSVAQFRAALETWRRGRPLPPRAEAGEIEAATASSAGGPPDDEDTLVLKDDGRWEEALEGADGGDASGRRGGRTRKVVLATLIVLSLLGYAGYIFLRWFQVPTVRVPNVKGQPLSKAQEMLKGNGLDWEVTAEITNTQVPANNIIDQDPGPDTEVRRGRTIGLKVSKGPDLVQVPGVVGRHKFEAETVLNNYGFAIGEENKYDESVPEGYVIAQTPPEGNRAERGTKVFIRVSLGPPPPPFNLPNLVGSTRDDALRTLEESGLRPGRETFAPAGFPAGVVASQNPPPQTLVRAGEAVDLVVSTGCAATDRRTIPVEGRGSVIVRAVIADQAGQRVVYEQTHQPGQVVNIDVCWDGTPARLLVFFNGELRTQEVLP